MIATAVSTAAAMVTTLAAMSHAALSPSLVRVSMKTGMKAAESAPSPNRRQAPEEVGDSERHEEG